MLWSKAAGAGGTLGGGGEGWNISTAVFNQNFSVSSQDTEPFGLFFKPDGTKMYVCGNQNDRVSEYDLSTEWDVSTASFLQDKSVSTQEYAVSDLFFKPDGTKMYIIGYGNDRVHEYNLSTAWNVSTASFLQSFNVGPQETNPYGLFFKPDGTRMYITGTTGDDVNEYDLSTAWNVSTASYLQNFSVSTETITPVNLFLKPDGTKMYITGFFEDAVFEYNLATAWDVSTVSFLQSFSVVSQESTPFGLFFKTDGTKMYILGQQYDRVVEYDVSS